MKHFNFLSNWLKATNTPPCKHKGSSHVLVLILILLTLCVGNAWGADVITQSSFSNISTSGYNNYTCTGTSGASYLINFYKNGNTNMNFKKTTVSSGFVVTSAPSGKKIKSVTVTFGNQLNIYWSNTNYASNAIAKNADESSAVSMTSGTACLPTSTATSFRLYSPSTAATVSQISIEWEDASPSYTITAQSNNTNYGTVSGTTTITASPKTGYRVSTSTPYTISPANSATVNQNGNTFSVTASANTTITINFEEIPSHNIIFNTGGLVSIDNASVKEGVEYTVTQTPAASLTSSCEYGTFVGWTTSSSIANASVQPTLITNNKVTMSTSDINLYAVYSKTTGGTGASVGATLWAEDFSGYAANDNPDGETTYDHTGTTVYNNGSVTYASTAGTDSRPKIFEDGGPGNNGNNLLIYKKNGLFSVSGISTGQAATLTLSFGKGGSGTLSVIGSDNISISASTSPATITVNSGTSFDLTFKNTNNSSNLRFDDVSVIVATTSNAGTTTYSLDANCCEPLAQINGSISLSQVGGDIKVDWTEGITGATGYIAKVYADNNNAKGDYTGISATVSGNSATSVTISDAGLTVGTKYWIGVSALDNTGTTCPEGTEKMAASSITLEALACALPSFDPAEGTYNTAQTITLSCATEGASIYYTMGADPADPTAESTLYDADHKPVVSVSTTIKAIAIKGGLQNSSVASATYTLKCATPTFTPNGGTSNTGSQEISIASTDGATIYYTLNGDEPDNTKTLYEGAFTITDGATVKAIAYKTNWTTSDVATSEAFVVNHPRTVTFDAGTGTLSIAQATLTEESYGAGVTLPSATPSSACAAEGWTFAGWATANNTTVAPTLLAEASYDCAASTLYAVYKNGDGKYHLVTTLPSGDDIPGKYMIVCTSEKKALEAATVSNKAYQLYGATISNITDNAFADTEISDATYRAKSIWDVTYESNHWIFKNANTNKYLYGYISGNYHNISIKNDKPTGFDVTLSDGYSVISSADADDVNVFYSTTDSRFEGTDGDTKNIHLYKLEEVFYTSTPACCEDEVTIAVASATNGTFTVKQSEKNVVGETLSTCTGNQVVTVTCVPVAGYHVNEVTETIGTGVTIAETSTNVYTITYAKNVSGTSTISVSFAETENASFSISQNSFTIGDVAKDATVQRTFTVSAAHLEGTSLDITSNNEKYSVSPSSLTIKADGSVDEATVTVTLNTVAVGGPFAATITLADGAETPNTATVTLSATVKNQYTINWYVNGESQEESATYLDGETITKPESPESCDASISFMGWTTAAIEGKQADAPETLLAAEDITTATADADYYAVFAKAGETSWTETALADLTSDDVFVIADNGDSYLAMTNDNGTTHPLGSSITVVDNKITSEVANNLKWKLSGNATDGYTFYPNGSSTTWLYCGTTASSGSNDNMKVGTGDRKVFEWNNGWLRTKDSNTTRYVSLYTTTPDWRGYINTTTAPTNMVFFKYASTASKDYMTTCSVAFSVTYKAGTGTGDDVVVNNIAKNAPHTVLSNDDTNFSKTGYHFTGWKLGDDDYAAGDEIEHITADLTFVAQWEVTTFTMSYSANGGTVQAGKEALENESVNEGDSYTVKDNVFVKEGKLFAGWKVGNVDYAEGAVFTPTGNMEFVAQWTDKATCALTLVVNGEVQTPINIPQGEESNIELSPTAVGEYTFVGWAETPEAADVESITTMLAYTPVANETAKTLYAVYTRTETGATVTDVLTAADLAATGTSYVEFSDVQKISAAKYAGKTAKNGENIQINEKSKQGIYSTVSAGELVSVTIEMNSATKKLGVYGSNDGFTGYASIPSQEGVTKIEDFASVTSKTVTPISAYKYVGITSSEDGAKQISSISITWQSKTTYYTTAPGELRSVAYNLGTTPAGAWKENEGCADTHVKSGLTYDICEDEPVREGFNFDGWTVTGGTLTGNTITIGNSDVEISAKWVAKAQSNLIYSDGAETPATVVVENVEEGTVVTMPTVGTEEGQINLSKSGYDFKGWMYDGHLYKAGETFIMPAEAATLIAQWKKQNVEKMTLVTGIDQLVNGSKVVIAHNDDGSEKDCVAADLSGKYLTVTSATFADNTVTYTEADAVVFTLEVAEGGWKLRKDADNYLTTTAGGDLSWATAANASVWAISVSPSRTTIISNSKYLQYNYNSGTDPRMKGYSGNMGEVLLYTKMTNVTSTTTLSEIGYVEGDVIVVDNNSTLTIDNSVAPTNVTVKSGSTVVVNSDKNVDANSVIVEKGGKLEISGNVETDEPLVIYTTLGKGTGTSTSGNAPGSSSQIIGASNLTANGDVYMEIELTQDAQASAGWYAFSVPFEVDAMNGVYFGETKLTNEVGYAIMSHDGALRAENKYAWKKFRGIMQPGVFYVITVGNTDYKTLRFKKVAGAPLAASTSVPVSPFPSQTGSDSDGAWNGIGNPNLAISNLSTPVTAMQFYDHKTNSFIGRNHSVNLVVGSAFFIQYNASSNVSVPIGTTSNNGYLAPKRAGRAIENEIFEISLINRLTEEMEDNVFLSAREEATNSYEIGLDVAKMSLGTAKCAQMMIPAYGTNLCAADFPLVNDKAEYPLTITAPAAGNYRIEAAEAYADADIYLTKDGSIIWNLTMSAYELDLEKGTTSEYGLLLQARAPQIATGVEDVQDDKVQCTKVVINDNVFILRGEQLFDVTGKMVK